MSSRESGNRPFADGDPRRMAPSAARNRDVILDVLRSKLPQRGLILEIASGTGEHVVHFAQNLSAELSFQPSDPDAEARASIDAWVAASGLTNILPALDIDVHAVWPVARADAVIAINMIHISPWSATPGLLSGAGRVLPAGGVLFLYGPFRRGGRLEPSNEAFDAGLKARNSAWGVRDLEAVRRVASDCGFGAPEIVEMPANNLSVIFRRA
jgi:cyclopropane fatty-acyl-phospholipid synthase-like methyltransferase